MLFTYPSYYLSPSFSHPGEPPTQPPLPVIPLTLGVWVCKCDCSAYSLSWHFSGRAGHFHNCSNINFLRFTLTSALSLFSLLSSREVLHFHKPASVRDTTIFISKYTKSLWQCTMHSQCCKILRHGIFMSRWICGTREAIWLFSQWKCTKSIFKELFPNSNTFRLFLQWLVISSLEAAHIFF